MVTNVSTEAKLILDTINELGNEVHINVGRYSLTEYLVNPTAKPYKSFNKNKCSLLCYPIPYIYNIINALIANGYIVEKEYKVRDTINYTLAITDKGKKLINSDKPIELDLNCCIKKVANGLFSMELNRFKALKKLYFKNFTAVSSICSVPIFDKEQTINNLKTILGRNQKPINGLDEIINNQIDFSAPANYFEINTVEDGSIYDLIAANANLIKNELNKYTKYRNIGEMFRFIMSTLKVAVNRKYIQDEFIDKVTQYLIKNNYLKSETEIGTEKFFGLVITTRVSIEYTNTCIELSTTAQNEIISRIADIAKV